MMHNGLLSYEFSIPRELGPAFDLIAYGKDRAMRVAGEKVLREIGEGQCATVMYRWHSEVDYVTMTVSHRLTVDLCPVQRREMSYMDIPEMSPAACLPKAKEPTVSRIGRFFSDKWKEAGEVVESCKA